MNDRHEVLKDSLFWLKLEYGMSGWFRTCGNNSLGGYWCDGFSPVSVRNTRDGIEVSGTAWVVDGRGSQDKYSFTAAIPQLLLGGRRANVVIGDLTLDLNRKDLRFSVVPEGKSPNNSLERSHER